VNLIGAFNPADDVDEDGIQDLADNCPFEPNGSQANSGAFLVSDPESDFLGDACQCGEATADGVVLAADYDAIFDYLAGQASAADIEERCSVIGTPGCDIRDLVALGQELAKGPGVGSVEPRCDAALSPPPGP
jgi:hypothetical protein